MAGLAGWRRRASTVARMSAWLRATAPLTCCIRPRDAAHLIPPIHARRTTSRRANVP